MDQIDFDVYFKSADRVKFCGQYCLDLEQPPFRTTTASPYIIEYVSPSSDQFDSAEGEGSGGGATGKLSASGILHYYRGFIHAFLEKLKHEVS